MEKIPTDMEAGSSVMVQRKYGKVFGHSEMIEKENG
jgi:hypothetical protein